MRQRTISMTSTRRNAPRLLHVETPLGIVNIYTQLNDSEGRRVERVEYIPNDYAGEPKVATDNGTRAIRAVEQTERGE
jgi:hypothetical protein